jgi:hypothetical protein
MPIALTETEEFDERYLEFYERKLEYSISTKAITVIAKKEDWH